MFKLLVYSNLTFAVLYFLLYLQEGSWYAIAGILMVIVFSAMSLTEIISAGVIKKAIFYFTAIACLGFSGFLVFSSLYVLLDAIDHAYYPFRIIFLCVFGLFFSFSILSLLFYIFFFKEDRNNM
jgi:hypothetical protein